MATPLFLEGDASDAAYRNIRDAKDGPLRAARFHCEYLWILFQHHADREFRNELRSNFDSRYWEMYLTTSLILSGYEVACPKPGPDVGINYRGQRIWFEATSPTRGADGSLDQVPELKFAAPGEPLVVHDTPNEKIILRYLNSISVKYNEQYASWLKKGIVSANDAFVIAINPREIQHEIADTSPPRILQAGYTVGAPYMTIDRATGKAIGSGYHFRDHLVKVPKKDAKENDKPATVATGVFQQEQTGNFVDSGLHPRFWRPVGKQIQSLAAKFPTQWNREFISRNRECFGENREFSRLNWEFKLRSCFGPHLVGKPPSFLL